MSSTLGSNCGSQQPFMRANILKQFHSNFIIIPHRSAKSFCWLGLGMSWKTYQLPKLFLVDWDSGCNEKLATYLVPHEKYYTVLLYAPYYIILGCMAWVRWPERDLYLPCATLKREIPQSTSSPKKVNWENHHRSSLISSTLSSNSGSQQPFMQAKFTALSSSLHRFHHQLQYFIIVASSGKIAH